jgi:hypothetical protein
MLAYKDKLQDFFSANEIVDGDLYIQKLGIIRTEDLVHFSDDYLHSLNLLSDQFLQLWTARVFVQLHKASWKWRAVLKLLVQYRDELITINYPGTEQLYKSILESLAVSRGIDQSQNINKKSKCQLVLDSLRSMMHQLMICKYGSPPPPVATQSFDARPHSHLPSLLLRLKNSS